MQVKAVRVANLVENDVGSLRYWEEEELRTIEDPVKVGEL